MFPGSGNGHTVQNLKEVKVQHGQEVFCGTLLRFPFAPGVECFLSIPEDLINGTGGFQLVIDQRTVAHIGKLELVFQIIEPGVDRGR